MYIDHIDHENGVMEIIIQTKESKNSGNISDKVVRHWDLLLSYFQHHEPAEITK